MPLVLLISCIIMIWLNYRITHRIVNIISVLTFPYAILIPVNNFVMHRFGFYLINDEVITMILGAFFCVFLGSIIADLPKSRRSRRPQIAKNDEVYGIQEGIKGDDRYKWRAMIRYSWFVNVVTLIRLLLIIAQRGLKYLGTEGFSGVLTSGPLGHLLLSVTPLVPVLFYYWINHRNKTQYLLSPLISFGLFFLTFVKYHVLGIAIATYLLVSFENRKYIRKGGLLLAFSGTAVFIFNYFLSFFLRGVAAFVNSNYYFLHFWNYAAGSLIYDNRIFEQGVRVGTSTFYKLGTFLFAPVNLFSAALFNYRFFPHEKQPHYLVASNGQVGNVVDAIGYLYPSKGSAVDIIAFAVVMLCIGWLFTHIYNHNIDAAQRNNTYPTAMVYFLTYFVFLSFFGTFYINSGPYEILFWCWLMMKIFDKRVHINIGQRRLI